MNSTLTPNQLHVAVDLLILTVREGRLNLLLSKRELPPFAGFWALPGRMVAIDESAETAANKLLAEMLPVRNPFIEQLYTFTQTDRDPRGRVISVAYLVIVPWEQLKCILETGTTGFACFQVSLDQDSLRLVGDHGTIPESDALAFDHARMIRDGLQRLRNKIGYTDIGFSFLENHEAFSLSELQTVFEAVLDDKLDNSNFRRFILNRYEKSGRLEQAEQAKKRGRGRPAALYCLKQENNARRK